MIETVSTTEVSATHARSRRTATHAGPTGTATSALATIGGTLVGATWRSRPESSHGTEVRG